MKKDAVPAQIRVKLWLGFEKDEKDWLQMHIDETFNGAISIFAETVSDRWFIKGKLEIQTTIFF
jgi:hypothetical protein